MENTTNFCASCGKELEETQVFCPECGHPVTPPAPPAESAPEVPVVAVAAAPKGKNEKSKKEKVKKEKPQKGKKKKGALAGILTGSALLVTLTIIALVVTFVGATVCGIVFFGIPFAKYQSAQNALDSGMYDQAYQSFVDLGSFMDSEEMANRALYQKAMAAMQRGQYDEANTIFLQLGEYSDSADMAKLARYQKAIVALQNGQYDEAHRIFLELGEYSDSGLKAKEALYQKATSILEQGYFDEAYDIFLGLGDYADSEYMVNQALYQKAANALEHDQYDTAIEIFDELGDFRDSSDWLKRAKYAKAEALYEDEKYKESYLLYRELGDFESSRSGALLALVMWEANALNNDSSAMANDLKKTVTLSADQYELFYLTITVFVTGHEDGSYWFDGGATTRAKNVQILLGKLPATYEDVALYKELFSALTNSDYYYELFTTHAATMESCFSLPFVQDLATHNYAITYFLEGEWYTYSYNYYITIDEDHYCSHNLPRPTQPSNTAYYDIDGMIFYWDDIDGNHLTRVYRFEIVDYDTIRVYCYQNSQTYYLYRN